MENIKIYNKNVLEDLSKMESRSIDLICTDPPYKIVQHGSSKKMGGMFKDKNAKHGKIFENNDIDIEDWIYELYRVLKDDSVAYIMSNQTNIVEFINSAIKANFKFKKNLIWLKQNKIITRYYMNQFEYIIFLVKGKYHCINNPGTSEVLQIPNIKYKYNNEIAHPSSKPVELFKTLILNSSNKGDIVFDPFIGVGSSAIAAIETDRKFLGYEIDEKYFKIANERIQKYIKGTEYSECTKNILDKW